MNYPFKDSVYRIEGIYEGDNFIQGFRLQDIYYEEHELKALEFKEVLSQEEIDAERVNMLKKALESLYNGSFYKVSMEKGTVIVVLREFASIHFNDYSTNNFKEPYSNDGDDLELKFNLQSILPDTYYDVVNEKITFNINVIDMGVFIYDAVNKYLIDNYSIKTILQVKQEKFELSTSL